MQISATKIEKQKSYNECHTRLLAPRQRCTTNGNADAGARCIARSEHIPSLKAIEDKVKTHMLGNELSEVNVRTNLRAIRTLVNTWGVSRPTVENAKALKAKMREAGRSERSIRAYLYALKYWSEAYGAKLDLVNDVKLPDIQDDDEERQKKMFPKEDIAKIIEAGNTIRDSCYMAISLYTGCRVREISYVTLDDVKISDEAGQSYIIFRKTKGKKIKKVFLKDHVVRDYLKPWLSDRNQHCAMHGYDVKYLFITEEGTRWTDDAMRQMLNRVYEREGFRYEYFSPHCFRHTAGSHMGKTMSLKQLAETLGHSDARTTEKFYLHTNEEELKSAMSAFDY